MSFVVAFEGIDGSGKTTQIELLSQWLRAAGRTVRTARALTREAPFFRELEDLVGEVPRSSFCDVVAFERYRRIKELTAPSGTESDVILFDRYIFTDYAYARAYGCSTDFIEALMSRTLMPDGLVLCDVPADVAMARIQRRKAILHFQENTATLKRARAAFLESCTPLRQTVCVDSSVQSSQEIVTKIVAHCEGLVAEDRASRTAGS